MDLVLIRLHFGSFTFFFSQIVIACLTFSTLTSGAGNKETVQVIEHPSKLHSHIKSYGTFVRRMEKSH